MKRQALTITLLVTVFIAGTAHADSYYSEKWRRNNANCRADNESKFNHNNYFPSTYDSRHKPYFDSRGEQYAYRRGNVNELIKGGFRDGSLSYKELQELKRKQYELTQRMVDYRADGRVSNREQKKLKDNYRDFYHDLQHELNDGERRY